MTNPNKAKGTKAETAFTRFARANGFPDAERIDMGQGWGDVRLRTGVHVQVKNSPSKHSLISPPREWIGQALNQGRRASDALGFEVSCFLVVKPHGIGFDRVQDWHAWFPSIQTDSIVLHNVMVLVPEALRFYKG